MEQSSKLQVKLSLDMRGTASRRSTWSIKKFSIQLMRFGVTGGCNALIDILALNFLLWRFPTADPNIIVAYNTFAYLLGAVNSYMLNKYWTFRRGGSVSSGELLRFIIVNVAGIVCNDCIFWIAAELLHPSLSNLLFLTNASKISAIFGTALLSYLGMHLWVFKKTAHEQEYHHSEGISMTVMNTQSQASLVQGQSAMQNLVAEQTSTFLTTRSLSVILPAHNEEGVIATTVQSVVEVLTPWVPEFEVIVVNDGSKDETRAIVEAISQADPRVRLITHEANQGYGAALVTGFEAVTTDLAFFTDSDGQFNIQDLQPFFPLIEQYDAVLGYRIDRQDTWMRKLNAWGWHLLVTTIFGVKVRDVDCAFKLYRADFFRKNRLETRGAMINAEILYKLKRCGCTSTEVGVHHFPRTSGKATGAKLAVILRAMGEMFSYARKWQREELPQRELYKVEA